MRHRRIGRIAIVAGLTSGVFGVLFGFFLSFGGTLQASASVRLRRLVRDGAIVAYRAVRRRDITTHRRWMIRAFAVGLAVGTIRIWIGLFEGSASSRPGRRSGSPSGSRSCSMPPSRNCGCSGVPARRERCEARAARLPDGARRSGAVGVILHRPAKQANGNPSRRMISWDGCSGLWWSSRSSPASATRRTSATKAHARRSMSTRPATPTAARRTSSSAGRMRPSTTTSRTIRR